MNNKITYYYNYTYEFFVYVINYIKTLYNNFPNIKNNSSDNLSKSSDNLSNYNIDTLYECFSSDQEELTEIKVEQINKFLDEYIIINHDISFD